MGCIAIRLEAIASRLEAITIIVARSSWVGGIAIRLDEGKEVWERLGTPCLCFQPQATVGNATNPVNPGAVFGALWFYPKATAGRSKAVPPRFG